VSKIFNFKTSSDTIDKNNKYIIKSSQFIEPFKISLQNYNSLLDIFNKDLNMINKYTYKIYFLGFHNRKIIFFVFDFFTVSIALFFANIRAHFI
jgi:hypothetical protein